MTFEVLKVNDRDIKNGYYVGGTFEGEWEETISRDYIDIIVWDEKNFRGISPDKIRIIK